MAVIGISTQTTVGFKKKIRQSICLHFRRLSQSAKGIRTPTQISWQPSPATFHDFAPAPSLSDSLSFSTPPSRFSPFRSRIDRPNFVDANAIASDLLPYALQPDGLGAAPVALISMLVVAAKRILCVHGNPTWSFYWRRVIERFSPSHRVVAIDHIGCGRSDKPPRDQFDYSLASHRDNLIALIDHLDLQRITLLAHDWGGAIGLSSMLERQDRLERIILLNTGAFPPPYVPWRIAACRIPLLGTLGVRGLNLFARAAVPMAMSRQRMSDEVGTRHVGSL